MHSVLFQPHISASLGKKSAKILLVVPFGILVYSALVLGLSLIITVWFLVSEALLSSSSVRF